MPSKYDLKNNRKYNQNHENDQNTPETYKITKIPLNLKNDRNTSETYKVTKIPPKSKNYQNTP